MFLTFTLPSYGPVTEKGAPSDPGSYDYRRAALDGLHSPKLVDRLWQNIRGVPGTGCSTSLSSKPNAASPPICTPPSCSRGGWSVLTGVALIQATNTPWWSGVAGIVVGALLMMCSLEFVGAFEQEGWKLARVLTPIAYVAWSLWLIVVGVALLL
jgi:hypothetical protein